MHDILLRKWRLFSIIFREKLSKNCVNELVLIFLDHKMKFIRQVYFHTQVFAPYFTYRASSDKISVTALVSSSVGSVSLTSG